MSVTREKIIELGEDLIRTRGYNAFSYQDISTAMGIKNAAVHYYFPSKENLGTAIIKTNIQRFEEMIDNMNNLKFEDWHQLETFLKIYVKSHREKKLCIVGSLGSDYNTFNDSMKTELKKMTDLILEWLSNLLRQGREKGIFAFVGEPKDKAFVVFTSMVASLQLLRFSDRNEFKAIYQSVLDDLKP
jgi:TetR/AcrR family transcriptional regulator, transcriptional repressor for nem operon